MRILGWITFLSVLILLTSYHLFGRSNASQMQARGVGTSSAFQNARLDSHVSTRRGVKIPRQKKTVMHLTSPPEKPAQPSAASSLVACQKDSDCSPDELCLIVRHEHMGPRGAEHGESGDHLCHRKCANQPCASGEQCLQIKRLYTDHGWPNDALCISLDASNPHHAPLHRTD